MYHLKTNQTHFFRSLFVLGLFMSLQIAVPCLAKTAAVAGSEPLPGKASVTVSRTWPQLPSAKRLKEKPVVGVEIYEYDSSPADNRLPLLMVHGLEGENKQCFRWDHVCDYVQKDEAFKARYKVLLARYNTHIALADVVPHFRQAVSEISTAFGGKRITMIALSMGGNVIQQAMVDPATSSRVERVLAMGSPFHGSPLFASDWMRFSMAKHYRLPLMRVDNCLPYTMYFNRHKNLLSDLPWDNCDNKIPNVGKFNFIFPYRITGTLSPSATGNRALLKYTEPGVVDKSKFVVYGAYLDTLVAKPKQDTFFRASLHYPSWLIFTKLPEHCGKEHPVLRVLNEHIAHAITDKERGTKGGGNVYGLNDGITPLASALFLSDAAMGAHEFKSAEDVAAFKQLVDVRKARVFQNIDHVSFIDGYMPRGRSPLLRDELSPGVPERPIFQWILSDLMDQPDQSELASESPKQQDPIKD
jgi:hypothetical protein